MEVRITRPFTNSLRRVEANLAEDPDLLVQVEELRRAIHNPHVHSG